VKIYKFFSPKFGMLHVIEDLMPEHTHVIKISNQYSYTLISEGLDGHANDARVGSFFAYMCNWAFLAR
jgi:hypothetical protein